MCINNIIDNIINISININYYVNTNYLVSLFLRVKKKFQMQRFQFYFSHIPVMRGIVKSLHLPAKPAIWAPKECPMI